MRNRVTPRHDPKGPLFLIMILSLAALLFACQAGLKKGRVANLRNPLFLKEDGLNVSVNPHIGERCNVCHRAEVSLLAGIMEGRIKNGKQLLKAGVMKTDLNSLCSTCHAGDGDHVVGVAPALNRYGLPLDHEGRMNCATTCHDVHVSEESDSGMKRNYLRRPTNKLCFSCHDI